MITGISLFSVSPSNCTYKKNLHFYTGNASNLCVAKLQEGACVRDFMFKKLHLIAILSCFLSAPVYAEEGVIKLCDALSKDGLYKNNGGFEKIIAGKDHWIFRTKMDLKDDMAFSDWSKESFKRLREAFNARGTELAAVMLPTRGMIGYNKLLPPYRDTYDQGAIVDGYALMLDDLASAGLIVADTRNVAQESPDFFLKRDNHWTAHGARYSAQKMAEAIKAHHVYGDIPRLKFATGQSVPDDGSNHANDRFLKFIDKVCGEKLPREIINMYYKTEQIISSDDMNALFEDVPKPEIVLLGTSNSTPFEPSFANFPGFLREYLSADLENKSLAGGSFRGAIGNYVMGGEFGQANPKVVIWELSAHYGFDQKETFRELIPAVYGDCTGDNIVAQARGVITKGDNIIFVGLKDHNMSSYGYYLSLTLANKSFRDFKVHLKHVNQTDKFSFKRSKKNFEQNSGRYFVELRDGFDKPLDAIILKAKGDHASGNYVAKMCKVPVSQSSQPVDEGVQ